MPRMITGIDLGKCINFDSTTDRVSFTVPTSFNATNIPQFTVAAWIFPRSFASVAAARRVIDWDNGISVGTGSRMMIGGSVATAGLRFDISHQSPTTGVSAISGIGTLKIGQWNRIMGSWSDADTVPKLYINGVQVTPAGTTSKAGSRLDGAATQTAYIGNESAFDANLESYVDEVCVWNRVLTANEIANDYFRNMIPTDSALILRYSMNEASGSVVDTGTSGTVTGTPTNVTQNVTSFSSGTRTASSRRQLVRNFGNCLLFNGSTAWVSIPSTSALNISNKLITLMAWVYPLSYSGNDKSIIAKMDSDSSVTYQLRIQSTFKRPRFVVDTDASGVSATTSNTVPLNKWTHVAATYDGTNARFYINGIVDSSPAFTLTPDSTTNAVSIGAKTAGGGDFFNGYIDEAFVYNATLTPTEILEYYYTGIYPTSGLLSYHKFDEGSGTTTTDASGNNNTGTLSGATTPSWSSQVITVARTAASGRGAV